ncbi:MAG TPA: hypothetical protein VK139_07105 [Microbacteriaceae bacterium]|nr:hypothetical protein [Microbacteriaceae bacterium]
MELTAIASSVAVFQRCGRVSRAAAVLFTMGPAVRATHDDAARDARQTDSKRGQRMKVQPLWRTLAEMERGLETFELSSDRQHPISIERVYRVLGMRLWPKRLSFYFVDDWRFANSMPAEMFRIVDNT